MAKMPKINTCFALNFEPKRASFTVFECRGISHLTPPKLNIFSLNLQQHRSKRHETIRLSLWGLQTVPDFFQNLTLPNREGHLAGPVRKKWPKCISWKKSVPKQLEHFSISLVPYKIAQKNSRFLYIFGSLNLHSLEIKNNWKQKRSFFVFLTTFSLCQIQRPFLRQMQKIFPGLVSCRNVRKNFACAKFPGKFWNSFGKIYVYSKLFPTKISMEFQGHD